MKPKKVNHISETDKQIKAYLANMSREDAAKNAHLLDAVETVKRVAASSPFRRDDTAVRETMSIDRVHQPTYRFEAFDKLTLCGEQHIWDYQHPSFAGVISRTIFGMGWRRNYDPSTTSQIDTNYFPYSTRSPKVVTLLGIIYSLIFDTDQENLGLQDLNVINWDTLFGSDVAGIARSLENIRCSKIDWYLFKDPTNRSLPHHTGDYNLNWNVANFLNQLCIMFRMRLFQKDGEYYLVQWEAYQGDPTAGNMRVHTYRNDLRTTSPTGSIVHFPDYSFTTVLGSTDFTTDINTHPRTDPE